MLPRFALPGMKVIAANLHFAPLAVLAILDDPSEKEYVVLLIGVIVVLVKIISNVVDKFFGKEKDKAPQAAKCGYDHSKLHELFEEHDHSTDLAMQAMKMHHEQEIGVLNSIHSAIRENNTKLDNLIMTIMRSKQ